MTFSTAFWAALAALATGAYAVWMNPRRGLNRLLSTASLHLALWLASVHVFFAHGFGGFWARTTAVLLATLLLHAWMVRGAILQPGLGLRDRLRRGRGWLVFEALMILWAASPLLIPYGAASGAHGWPGQIAFLVAIFVAAVVFEFQSVFALQARSGVRRIEAQLLLLGVGAGTLMSAALCGLASVWKLESLLELMPLVVVACHASTVWVLTSKQVLDPRHVLSAVMERIVLLAVVVVFVWAVQQVAEQFVHGLTAYALSLAVGFWGAAAITPWLRAMFRRRSRSARLRRNAYEVATTELRPEALEDGFIRVIMEGTQTDRVAILMSSQSRLTGGGLDFPVDDPAMKMLHALRWVTLERLERERFSAEREPLRKLLSEHGFGLMIANGGPTIAFVVAIGVPLTRQPFTQPDILRLIDVAATLENSLSRARYLRQAQQSEQLATVGLLGASIAHEIRNPLVSIKTFVQLLPEHYQEAAFRQKFFRLIGDEVGRIDRLTEQLLDLASPRVFAARAVELHPILNACIDLVTAKADDKGVRLIAEFKATSDLVQIDPNAVKQVVLNLSFNAIQALEHRDGERWIRFKTTKVADCVEIEVSDSGPGLTPEVWNRLFQPFQSTKSTGFGLGLAICKDILSSLHANISADLPTHGQGATFRITLPCPQPTS